MGAAEKKKGGLVIAFGNPSKPNSSPKDEPSADEESTEEEDAAKDILDAIKSGDHRALSTALKLHQELGESEEEGESPDEGDDGEEHY